jgi:hypothetical protein
MRVIGCSHPRCGALLLVLYMWVDTWEVSLFAAMESWRFAATNYIGLSKPHMSTRVTAWRCINC